MSMKQRTTQGNYKKLIHDFQTIPGGFLGKREKSIELNVNWIEIHTYISILTLSGIMPSTSLSLNSEKDSIRAKYPQQHLNLLYLPNNYANGSLPRSGINTMSPTKCLRFV